MNDCLKVRGYVKSWARVSNESHEYWPSTNNESFTLQSKTQIWVDIPGKISAAYTVF